jgi:hydroxyacylglutathione hydrolase
LNSHTDSSADIVDIAAGLVRILNDAYASNAYVLIAGSRALVVDPSDAKSGRIARFLHARGVTEIFIVLTHEHFDHISGVSHLENEFPNTHVLSSRACSERIASPTLNLSRYMTSEDIVCAPATLIAEDLAMPRRWGASDLSIIPTPGHSPGSICMRLGSILFSGDTLIKDSPTVTRLPGGSAIQLAQSLARLRSACDRGTLVCPGHGAPFLFASIDESIILGSSAHAIARLRGQGV